MPLETILPEECAIFNCTVWTKMRFLEGVRQIKVKSQFPIRLKDIFAHLLIFEVKLSNAKFYVILKAND